MAKQVINVGSSPGDVTADSIRNGGIKINDNYNELYDYRPHFVTDYGAIGNANYSTGGGNNDTTAIQATYDAAAASGGRAAVIFPGRRTYRITSTINVPLGITTHGMGGHDGQGGINPPIIVWDGADAGVMFLVHAGISSTATTSFINLCIRGGQTITNQPAAGLKFSGSVTNKVDSGCYVENVWFQWISGHGIHFANHGSTNFYILGGRFDTCSEYGIYLDLTGSGKNFYATIVSPTWVGGRDPQGKGFLFCNGEGATSFGSSSIQIIGLHTEQNQSLTESFAAGTNPYDRRGVIRLGVSPGLSNLQHRMFVAGWDHNQTSTDESHSAFQITAASGTDAQASECVSIVVSNASGLQEGNTDAATTGEIRMFGGKVPASQRYPFRGYRHGQIVWGRGKESGTDFEQCFSFINTHFRVRGMEFHPNTVANLPAGLLSSSGGAVEYVTDASVNTVGTVPVVGGGSGKALVMYTGTQWRVIAQLS